MNKVIQYIGLDVHKDSIAVSIAPQNSTEVRRYGIIRGTLDAVDKLIKKLSADTVDLRVVYEAGPGGFHLHRQITVRWCPQQCGTDGGKGRARQSPARRGRLLQ